MEDAPLAYLITIRSYGTWLHGDERGSMDRNHIGFGDPLLSHNFALEHSRRTELKSAPMTFDERQRRSITATIEGVCAHNEWTIHAINVRINHVHIVATASKKPERVMNAIKSWATRRMIEQGLIGQGAKVWSRHGSTCYLWDEGSVEDACAYVVDGQGADITPGGAPSRSRY